MKLLLLLGFFLYGMKARRVEVVEVRGAELMQAEEKLAVTIEIDAAGKVSASCGGDKLAAFVPKRGAKMKPLNDWLAKLKKKGPPKVSLKVNGNAQQALVIDVLNVLAAQGITEIVFKDVRGND